MLLTGTFVRSVDDKLRIALPKRLRDALAADENSHIYITPGTDGSLAIYREDTLAAMAAQTLPLRRRSRTSGLQSPVLCPSRMRGARCPGSDASAAELASWPA